MKKFVLGMLAISGLVMSQASADYCCPQECCDSNAGFEGLYIGGNVGAITNTAHRNDFNGYLTGDPAGFSFVQTGFTGGLQLGYDFQCQNKLVGVVGDFNWVDIERNRRIDAGIGADDISTRDRNKWFSTIRARAGIVVCDALVYVTAGGAVSKVHTHWHSATHVVPDFDYSKTRWGWAGGVGTEFKVWCDFSVGLELLYLAFDERNHRFLDGTTTRVFGNSDTAWVGRVNVNYRFNLNNLFGGNLW